MSMLNQNCRDCSHENVCRKKTDHISYIFTIKDTERHVPEGIDMFTLIHS